MNFKQFKTKLISLVMVFTLLFGVSATTINAIAVEVQQDRSEDASKDTLNYVSLGDSMSNGYGLDSAYKHNGFNYYASTAYPNLFAAWLERETGTPVNHSQFAMSGQRVEDIRFTLELDYDDPKVIEFFEIIDKNNDRYYSNATRTDYYNWTDIPEGQTKTVEQLFLETFDVGDLYTYKEFIDGRYNYWSSPNYPAWENAPEGTLKAAEKYQNAVKDADIISYGAGNGNYGVFLFGRVMNAMGFNGGDPSELDYFRVEDAIRDLDAEEQAFVLTYVDELYKALDKQGMSRDGGEATVMDKFIDVFVYTTVSYMANYIGTMNAIVQMNPDVEVILLALMNTYGGDPDKNIGDLMGGNNISEAISVLSIGDLLQIAYGPLNNFIAAYPTFIQARGDYKDAKFYYADTADGIECMIEVYGEDFYLDEDKDGNGTLDVNYDSITRDRFVNDIVGICNCQANCNCDGDGDRTTGCQAGDYLECNFFSKGLVWSLVSSMGVVPLSIKEILAYDSMNDEQRAEYAYSNSTKVASLAIYLAFEKAILLAGHGGKEVSVNSVLGLGSIFSNAHLFDNIFAEMNRNLPAAMAEKKAYTYGVLAGVFEGILNSSIESMLGANIGLEVSNDEIAELVSGDSARAEAAAAIIARRAVDTIVALNAPTYVSTVEAQAYSGIKDTLFAGINGMLNQQISAVGASINLTAGGYYEALTGKAFEENDVTKRELIDAFYADAQNDYAILAQYIDDSLKVALGSYYDMVGITGAYVVGVAKTEYADELAALVNAAGTIQTEAAIKAATEAYIDSVAGTSTVGLIKAISTFNKDKNIKLATYASRCIENEILMYIRKSASHKREVSIDEPLSVDWDGNELLLSDILGSEGDSISGKMEEDEERGIIRNAVRNLNERERTIIEMRFGLIDGKEQTQKEVADILGISQSYISRLEKKIMLELRKKIEEKL